MKVLVLGANGQLGNDIVSAFEKEHEVIGITHDDIDIGNLSDIHQLLLEKKPNILINTTAFHHVELCEQSPETAELVNAIAVGFMANICKMLHIKFVHFSTDYVFDGEKKTPYVETDFASPVNVYGKSKLHGEKLILENNPNALIIRISAIYGQHACRAKKGLNFIQLMLKLAQEKGEVKVVDDEFVSPTSTKNVVQQVALTLKSDINGIVHATSEGQCSWYEFAEEIFKYTHTKVNLYKGSSSDFPAKVNRPKYSVLQNDVLHKNNINIMLPWKDALHQYLDEIKK
ncbi:MAG: dTDP-4-dehydrorhamnose reductase [Bacteroidota bacterium]|nr:dTDP-4-dehydrorhamnose reductase [Bacteroidota bacterium]